MTIGRDLLTKAETVTVAAIEASVPALVEARELIAAFHLMIRRKAEAGLASWIERARALRVEDTDMAIGNLLDHPSWPHRSSAQPDAVSPGIVRRLFVEVAGGARAM
jgi:hypothetical protein